MSQYDGCPDPDCDGCEGTEPYFAKLPPAPPFNPTYEQLSAAMNAMFDKYPNVRINAPSLISFMAGYLKAPPSRFKEVEDKVYDFLAGEKHKGTISILKGKNGGLMRNHVGPLERAELRALDKQVESMPAINNHVCPHCKNDKVSKSESSCWKCGGSL